MSAQHLRVTTPQGDAGDLSHEQSQYVFGYQTVHVAAAITHCTNTLKEVFWD